MLKRHKIADGEGNVIARESNTWRREIGEPMEITLHTNRDEQGQWVEPPAICVNMLRWGGVGGGGWAGGQ